MLFIAINLEVLLTSGSIVGHGLVRKINGDGHSRILVYTVEELFQERFGHDNRQHKVVELVVLVDIGKERADNHAETISCDGPGCMVTYDAMSRFAYTQALSINGAGINMASSDDYGTASKDLLDKSVQGYKREAMVSP